MIVRITDLPANVLGLTATGTVTAHDYESVVMPAVESLFATHKKVSFLYHIGAGFTGFEAAAMWDDAKVGMKHLAGWDKIAVVSDVEWIRAALKVFGLAMHGRVRAFHDRELAEAKRWVSA